MRPLTVPSQKGATQGQPPLRPQEPYPALAPARRRPLRRILATLASLAPAAALLAIPLVAPDVHSAALPMSPPGLRAGEAAAQAVTLAEVTTQVDPAATHLPDLKDVLRRSVEAELRIIDWGKEGLRRRYKLSAAVMRLETASSGGVQRSSCSVSTAVRDERGKLLAIIEGRARAEEPGVGAASTERGALEGAVQGAIRRLPEAIRQSQ